MLDLPPRVDAPSPANAKPGRLSAISAMDSLTNRAPFANKTSEVCHTAKTSVFMKTTPDAGTSMTCATSVFVGSFLSPSSWTRAIGPLNPSGTDNIIGRSNVRRHPSRAVARITRKTIFIALPNVDYATEGWWIILQLSLVNNRFQKLDFGAETMLIRPDSSTDPLRWIFCHLCLINNGLRNSPLISGPESRLRGYRHPVIEQASNPLDDLLN